MESKLQHSTETPCLLFCIHSIPTNLERVSVRRQVKRAPTKQVQLLVNSKFEKENVIILGGPPPGDRQEAVPASLPL